MNKRQTDAVACATSTSVVISQRVKAEGNVGNNLLLVTDNVDNNLVLMNDNLSTAK